MRWLRRIAVGIAIAVVVSVVGAYAWLRSGLPELDGMLRLAGAPEIAIERDERGIALLDGANEQDVYYALGIAHAQDRPAQLELARRVASGRLSELVGPSALKIDRTMRRFGFRDAAARAVPFLSPRAHRILDAYAAGVTAYLTRPGASKPHEIVLASLLGASVPIEPWTAIDSLVCLKLMALDLSGDSRDEELYTELVAKLGQERAQTLFDDDSDAGPVQVESPRASRATERPARALAWLGGGDEDELAALMSQLGGEPGIGSNSWVISGAHTKSGKPILASDPHLAVGNPSVWYAVELHTPSGTLRGYTLPGVPALVAGRNDRIAWGITNLAADTQDFFSEKELDPMHYATPDGPREFGVRDEIIRIAGKPAETLRVRTTRHGPIMEETSSAHAALALRWTALDDDDVTFDCLLEIDDARSFDELHTAANHCVAPAVSFTYADVDGHIGYVAAGRIPVRKRLRGLGPQPGWTDDDEWLGAMPTGQHPFLLDPPNGFIVSANNRVVPKSDPRFIADRFPSPMRAARITHLLESATQPYDLDAVAHMHADVYSTAAARLVPLLVAAHPSHAHGAEAKALLIGWDRQMRADSPAAALFVTLVRTTVKRLFADDLGPLFERTRSLDDPLQLGRALTDASTCDDVRTPQHESCDAQLSGAFDDAIAALVDKQGDPARWRLDHTLDLRFSSQIGGRVPLLGSWYARKAVMSGDDSTVRVAHTDELLHVRSVSTFFSDFDLASPSDWRTTSTMGQSEHPFSPHFDDQLADWISVHPRPVGIAVHRLELAQ